MISYFSMAEFKPFIFSIKTQSEEDFPSVVCPSIRWNKLNLRLRPIPCQNLQSHQLDSSLGIDDCHEKSADNKIILTKI